VRLKKELVRDEGVFSLEKFSARFGNLKPAAPAVAVTPAPDTPAPVVVDLGGPGTAPNEAQASRKTELQSQLKAAYDRGDLLGYINLQSQLAGLK
jgi:hypothetical protein